MAPNFAGTLMGITNAIANGISIIVPLVAAAVLRDEVSELVCQICQLDTLVQQNVASPSGSLRSSAGDIGNKSHNYHNKYSSLYTQTTVRVTACKK